MGLLGFNTSGQFTVGGNPVNYGKNYIINGGFDRWEYATSQTTSGYGSDNRWSNLNVGSTKAHSQVACTDTERALFKSPYYSRTVVTSVTGATNYVLKRQAIENVTKLAGKTITISFWAKADTTKNIAIKFGQNFGSGGTPSTDTEFGVQLVALTSVWQKKTITVTVPSIVGKTIGSDGVHTSLTHITFGFDIGSTYSAGYAGLGQQSGTFDIAEVQLEEGSVATPLTPYEGEFGGEVQACARYYQKIGGAQNNDILIQGYQSLAGQFIGMTIGISKMRIPPICSKIGTWSISNATQPQIVASSNSTIVINIAALAAGASASGTLIDTYITASAEL